MKQISVKSEFSNKTSNISNAILHNYYFENFEFRRVRLSYLITNETQMFNSVWYPSIEYDCPILSIDLINFEGNKSLCFLNLVNIYDNHDYLQKYEIPFLNIKKKYPELSENAGIHLLPFKNFLSKAMLYGHVYDSTKFNTTIPLVLDDYINKYTNMFIKKPVNKYVIRDKHRSYNDFRYNIENNNYVTKRYFDNNWYTRLLNEYYF